MFLKNPVSTTSESSISSPNRTINCYLVSQIAFWELLTYPCKTFKETFSIRASFLIPQIKIKLSIWRVCTEHKHLYAWFFILDREKQVKNLFIILYIILKNFHTSWFVLGSSLYAETIILNLRSTFFTLHMPYMEHIMIY